MAIFIICNVIFGLGNKDYLRREVLAEADLLYEGSRLRLFLLPSGEVAFPFAFDNSTLHRAAAAKLRYLALKQLTARLDARTNAERAP